MNDRIVVWEFRVDEYNGQVMQQGDGFVWRLFSPSLSMQQPGPVLESLTLHRSIKAATRAARAAYAALPMVPV